MWSYVGRKTNSRWLWIAISRKTKHIVAYHLGSRSELDCFVFMQKYLKLIEA